MHQTDERGQSLLGTQGTLPRTSMCYCPMTQDVRVGETVSSVSGLGTRGCCGSAEESLRLTNKVYCFSVASCALFWFVRVMVEMC